MAMSGGAGHIIVCGERVPCGARVVTWEDQGGLSAYAPRRRSPDGGAPAPVTDSARTFGVRRDEGGREIAQLRAGAGVGPEARAALRARVHQLVAHYDGCGTARRCFRVLHDERGLSAHFIIDLDGTVWQTLDVRERAWHATVANDASVGVEICNVGACECTADGNACAELPARLARWYEPADAGGGRAGSESGAAKVSPGTKTIGGRAWRLLVPDGEVPALASLPHFEPPCDIAAVEGHVHGQRLVQMAFTRAQLRAVAALGAALSSALPGIVPAFPTADGATAPLWTQMPPEDLRVFRGLLGHFHVQTNKVDPGPAFPWASVVAEWHALLAAATDRRVGGEAAGALGAAGGRLSPREHHLPDLEESSPPPGRAPAVGAVAFA